MKIKAKVNGLTNLIFFVFCIGVVCNSSLAYAELKLASIPLATYVADRDEPARIKDIVTEAFQRNQIEVNLSVLRPAFLGSGLSNKSLDGDFAFLDLDHKKGNFVYSKPFLPLYLVAVSKRPHVKNVHSLPHLQDSRVAIDNRFVNTDQMRLEKAIKWSRNPNTYDAFRQLADGRSAALVTSSLLLHEFNLLLTEHKEAPLFSSPVPLVTAHFMMAVRADVPQIKTLLSKFDSSIEQMQQDGTYNRLLQLRWLLKDVNNDGKAEFISSTDVLDKNVLQPNKQDAFTLDGVAPAASPSYIIDGTEVNSWQEVQSLLPQAKKPERKSLLDETIYSRMMRRW